MLISSVVFVTSQYSFNVTQLILMLIFLLLKARIFFSQYCIRNANILLKFPHKQPSPQLPSPKPSKKNHKNTQLKTETKCTILEDRLLIIKK